MSYEEKLEHLHKLNRECVIMNITAIIISSIAMVISVVSIIIKQTI
jgi:hypothetical protein